jgi:hypothetical protein
MQKIIIKTWGNNLRLVLAEGTFQFEWLHYTVAKDIWQFFCRVKPEEIHRITSHAYERSLAQFVALVQKCELVAGNAEVFSETMEKLQATEAALTDAYTLLDRGRHYLMSVRAEAITVEDTLAAFGWQRNGL